MIRIDDCTHPTCCGGDCRKCEYNPKSGYSPYHYMPALPDTPATREARRQANILVATFAAGLLVLSMLPREAIMTWLRSFRFSRWHVPAAGARRWHVPGAGTSRPSRPLVPAAGTSRPSRPLVPGGGTFPRWHVSTFPAAGARRWHVPALARLDLPAAGARRWHVPGAGTSRPSRPLVPAAGTSRPSGRWCPPLARSLRPLVPAAGTSPGRWCPAQSPAAGTFPAAGKQFPSYYLTLPLLCRKLNYSRETN